MTAEPDPVIVLGIIAPHVSPIGAMSVNVTAPVNPLRPDIVVVEVEDWDESTGAGADATRVKSGKASTRTVTVELWESEPLVPVRVTV